VLRIPNGALRYKPTGEDPDTAPAAARLSGKHTLYRLEEGKPVSINVKTGISDNNYTEILEGDIKEGDKVIIRDLGEKGEKSGNKLRFRMF